jgi:hypothetical protein
MRRRIGLGVLAGLLLIGFLLLFRPGGRGPRTEAGGQAATSATARRAGEGARPDFSPAGRAAGARFATRARISGRITDPAGKPIAGALVCANGSSPDLSATEMRDPTCVPSGADGAYLLGNLYPAFWEVSASAAGYRPGHFREQKHEVLELAPGQSRTGIDLVLRKGGVEVRGRVKDLGGGVVAGALVVVGPGGMAWDRPQAVTRADEKGEWRASVAPGRVKATAMAAGYAEGSKEGTAPGSFVEILLTPESVLVGRVVEVGGSPVVGARVHSNDDSATWAITGSALTDGEGRFRIERLEPGRYKPVARTVDRYGQARESVVLGLGQRSAEVLIEVQPAATLAGKVLVTGTDKPCPEGWVVLQDPTAQRRVGGDPRRRQRRGAGAAAREVPGQRLLLGLPVRGPLPAAGGDRPAHAGAGLAGAPGPAHRRHPGRPRWGPGR